MNVYLESLGCAKNQVDSELMLGRLTTAGMTICDDPETADAIIVNTCAFIESATNEAIDTILEMARLKQTGPCQQLIVCGCLPERYRENLAESLPEVNCFLGTGAYDRIVDAVRVHGGEKGQDCLAEGKNTGCILPSPDTMPLHTHVSPRLTTTGATVYIKIAEGCDRRCTYCIIPRLRGRQRSRQPEDILNEVRQQITQGARELVLVAQETSAYGHGLTPAPSLSQLLADVSDIAAQADAPVRVRLLYLHPESLSRKVIQTIGERENLCAYFDIPVQHASDRVLKRMGRHYTAADLYQLFDFIRKTIPEASLRTTALVGFPGESDDDFNELAMFAEKIQFDHLGVFVYSDADDIPSHRLDGHVSEQASQERYDALMSAQAMVSLAKNNSRTGRTYDVLVEQALEPGFFCGRTWFQAPEVDGITCFTGPLEISAGTVAAVRMTSASEYDLTGEVE